VLLSAQLAQIRPQSPISQQKSKFDQITNYIPLESSFEAASINGIIATSPTKIDNYIRSFALATARARKRHFHFNAVRSKRFAEDTSTRDNKIQHSIRSSASRSSSSQNTACVATVWSMIGSLQQHPTLLFGAPSPGGRSRVTVKYNAAQYMNFRCSAVQ
jgi:hypothetical protein